jgi:deazaflavin-dependent oxidoreductase (nitroreductase family)
MLPPPVMRRGRWATWVVGGGITVIVGLAVLSILHLLVVAGIVTIVRHDAQLGARVLKRYNALILPFAGRRLSPYTLLRHTGRRSGRQYQTPLGAYRFRDGFVLGLTYGPESDWCRNVLASGHAVLKWHGQEYAVERPEIVAVTASVLRVFPRPLRPLLGRVLTGCLWLHQPSQDERG